MFLLRWNAFVVCIVRTVLLIMVVLRTFWPISRLHHFARVIANFIHWPWLFSICVPCLSNISHQLVNFLFRSPPPCFFIWNWINNLTVEYPSINAIFIRSCVIENGLLQHIKLKLLFETQLQKRYIKKVKPVHITTTNLVNKMAVLHFHLLYVMQTYWFVHL